MITHTIQHYFVGILAVANNLSALPAFLALVTGLTAAQSLKVVTAATFSSFLIMVISMFFGTAVLAFFGISMSAFQIAGGVLLGATGMSMINSKSHDDVTGKNVDLPKTGIDQPVSTDMTSIMSQAIVPVSLPLTTGAGTISTVTLFSEAASRTHTMIDLALAIVLMTVIIFFVFYYAIHLIKILGKVGMNVMVKVMGLFTLAIGVQFIVAGVSVIYKGLVG